MATVKHSKDFKQSHVDSHNATLEKMAAKWAKFGSSMPYTPLTLARVQEDPGYYIKDRGEWRGAFESEHAATEAKREWDYERKH